MGESQSRKWLLTINNPEEHGFTHNVIKAVLSTIPSIEYWCMCDEVGTEEETPHTHLFLKFPSGYRFSTLKKKFPPAHIDYCRGTCLDNRSYIRKEGKWKNTAKKEGNKLETFEESGECPLERQGARNDLADLYDMLKNGFSNAEIISQNPNMLLNVERMDKARQVIVEESFKNIFREMDVTYIFGKAGSGKTRYVMDKYGYDKVYRVTDYNHPFDTYIGQDVLMFEEFRSSLKIQDMLNYLDGYPIMLPARFNNRVACYTKVYIISNIPLEQQYEGVQSEQCETWRAFIRRIHHWILFDGNGMKLSDVNPDTDFKPCTSHDGNPFLKKNNDKYEQGNIFKRYEQIYKRV